MVKKNYLKICLLILIEYTNVTNRRTDTTWRHRPHLCIALRCNKTVKDKLLAVRTEKASRFHLGRQRQHSAVICSGALLFSSRVLHPSLVMLCSHKSVRWTAELYHSSHLWYLPFYTSPMASSALQHWTASPTKEGCHWQAGGENRQTWQLANAAWYT